MKLPYYAGCTLHTKAKNLNETAIKAAAKVGFELEEMPEWTCCGAIYSTNVDDLSYQVGPVRNLARASQMGDRLVTLCAACYNVLKRANRELSAEGSELVRQRLLDFVDEDFKQPVSVIHYLDVLRSDIGWDQLRTKVARPLEGLRVASYYGCLMVRPRVVLDFDDPENPVVMDQLVTALGGTPVDFDFKTECCGGYLVVNRRQAAVECSRRVLENIVSVGADVVATTCPLCQYNLDALQPEMPSVWPGFKSIPVLYFTQLLGMAVGLGEDELALDYNTTDARPVFREKGLLV
jgi:heterodisulfide reductase subunit B